MPELALSKKACQVATMQSTKPTSTRLVRISSSPDWSDFIDPFTSTNPALPLGARWWTICCTHAKLAFPSGGTPNCHRLSSAKRSPPPILHVERWVRQDEVCLQAWMTIIVEAVAVRDLPFNAAYSKIHACEPPRRVVGLLTID